jgi:putative polyketide hydroxylase
MGDAVTGHEDEAVQVLIVGAGAAGLATALELARIGLAPLVIERRQEPSSHPRATALTAETMQLMTRWGAGPEVRRLGFRSEHAMSIRSCLTGPEIQRLPFPDHVWTCAQDYLEGILAECAVAAGTQLRYGSQLTGLEPVNGAVVATVAARENGSSTIRAHYVVGADGAHSAVRQASGIAATRARDYGHWISILFRSPLRDYTGDEPCMVYGIGDPSASGVFVPADASDRWIRGLPWHPERGERLDDYDQRRCEDVIRSAAGVPDLRVEIVDIREFEMTASIADRYRAGRVILAGDAAHVFTPSTGMGLNLAIHDGTVLAQHLAEAIGPAGRPEMLDRYEQARRPLAEKLLGPDLAPAR